MALLARRVCFAALPVCMACVVSGCAIAPGSRDGAEPGPAPDLRAPRGASTPAPSAKSSSGTKPGVDRSGAKQVGKASFYAHKFAGRKMADGTRMDPNDDNAASKTLPLGTTARVTNLETGRSAVVTIQDRGPHVKGRIVDLSPATAREIGLSQKDGLAEVEVTPLAIPQAGGSGSGPSAAR